MKLKVLLFALSLIAGTAFVSAQSKSSTIGGKVTSFEESLALEGVTISVKGTNIITGTMADGTYSLDLPAGNRVLIFELKDYSKKEITINNEKQVDVVLTRAEGSVMVLPILPLPGNNIRSNSAGDFTTLP